MANAGMTRSAGATVSFKRNLGENRLASAWFGWLGSTTTRASRRSRECRRNPSERQTGYRCDPLVVAEERLPPLRWGLLCLAINNAVNCFGEPGAPDLVRRDAD